MTMTSKKTSQSNTNVFYFTFFQVCDFFAGLYWYWFTNKRMDMMKVRNA